MMRVESVKAGQVEIQAITSKYKYGVTLQCIHFVADLNDFSDERVLEGLIQFHTVVCQHVLNISIAIPKMNVLKYTKL